MVVDLAADGGQSGLSMAVVVAGEGLPGLGAKTRVPGFAWGAGVDEVRAQADAVERAWRALGSPDPVGTVACGLSGLDQELFKPLASAVGSRLGARRVVVAGDDLTTHAGALGGGAGAVLNAGTGVVSTAVAGPDRLVRVDAWGYLLGDAGGGSWLGREGLTAALAGADGRHPPTALTERAVARYGELRGFVHELLRSPTMVADVAAFAPDVLACAREGDETAVALSVRAADELVATATATIRRGFPEAAPGSVPFTWTGSVLTATHVVRDQLVRGLATACPAAAPRHPLGGGLEGAALLATGRDLVHLSLAFCQNVAVP
ncbi:MAG: hypothetical protein J2P24_20440 [Streptosporangiales bacterium]|nr:hypothetical protein [Streptosporangiales bacterium]